MSLSRLVHSLVVGFGTASLLGFCFGSTGLLEYGRLNKYHGILSDNIEELRTVNEALENEIAALRSSKELIRLYARALDYFESNERVIRIPDISRTGNFYNVGSLVTRIAGKNKERLRVLPFGMLMTVVLYAGGTVLERRANRHRNKRDDGSE